MKMTGEEIIAAPRQVVWDALNDPEVLKQCITGCDEIKKKSDTEFEAKVTARVGPVKASFIGAVKLSKLNPPRSYVISGEGKGGVAGFAKGGATVQLSDTADGNTKLSYDVDAQVGGKLAQIGSRLIDSTAKKMAADFFKKFNAVVSARAQAMPKVEETKTATKATSAKKAAAKKTAAKKAASKSAASKSTVSRAATAKATAKPAAKAASKPAAKTAAKPAAKAASKPAAKTAAKAASKPAAKTAAKAASKAAAKVASKPVAKVAAKSTAKTAKKPATKVAKPSKPATSPASGKAAAANQGAKPTAAAASTASTAASQASASASKAATAASTAVQKPADNMPPQAKSMTSMWMWIVIAAAIGLLAVWAGSGKG